MPRIRSRRRTSPRVVRLRAPPASPPRQRGMAIAERGALFAQTRPPTGLARLALARLVAAGAAIVLCTAAAGAAIIATAAGADGFELAQPAPGVYVHLGRALAL